MRHEQRYLFAHVFGFAGLTIDEMLHSLAEWWRGLQAPYLMPHVWHALLALVFGIGGVIGIVLALWTLSVRGLL